MNKLRNLILTNRYSLLLTTLAAYMLVLVIEGSITGREARVIDFENPFFDFDVRDFDEFREARQDGEDREDREDREPGEEARDARDTPID